MKKISIFLICSFLVGFALNSFAKKANLYSGSKAPYFSLRDSRGKMVKLSDFHGKKVVLYFFPKAGTPHCTKQAQSLRDDFAILEKKDIVIIGISSDSQKKLKKFSNQYNIPFLLLSDPRQSTIKKYGTKGLLFNKRKTFLIDEKGFIVTIIDKVDVHNHAKQIIAGFAL